VKLVVKREDVLTEFAVVGAINGDRKAFELLYRQWQPLLSRHASHLTRDRESTYDIMQDAWIAIAKGLRRLDDPSCFKGWAYRIVSNKSRDWIRKEQARRRLHDGVRHFENNLSGGATESIGAVSTLRDTIQTLPDNHRVILTLFYLEDWTVKDISAMLQLPDGTVKSRLYHARRTLKGALEKKNDDQT
jgi:RNA polymerase sigma-70 factor (ECF subfamily)